MLRFFLVFMAWLLALFGLNMLNIVQHTIVLPWTAALAQICAHIVTSVDHNVMATGKVLWNPSTGFGVSIEPGCNGIEACIVLFAGIMAYPSSWRAKLVGLGVGFLAIQSLNVVRVISLFYLGQWDDSVFQFAHEYLWQALIMMDALVVWLLWVRAVNRGRDDGQSPDDNPPSPPTGKSELAHV